MALTRSIDPLVWIDCEASQPSHVLLDHASRSKANAFKMTGLNSENDTILSIACFITDADLNLLDNEGFDVVIHHTEERLSRMDAWCTKTHGDSGLTKAAIESTTTAEQASRSLLMYVQRFVPKPRTALLAGNSVHADKMFLTIKPYDKVMEHLHYRILDVSAIKEAIRRWSPDAVLRNVPPKKGLHEARADILESIEEARYYQRLLRNVAP